MSLWTVLALLGGGLAAGFVNTVAGGGSVITIPILVELFDASIANGTNRIAILMQNVVGVARFQRGGAVPWARVLPLVPSVIGGALIGAWVATRIDADAMQRVFAVVIVLVAGSVLVKPSRWAGGTEPRLHEPWRSLVFFAIGFYGGFVQAGVGFLVLAGLVLGGGLGLVEGNAGKVLLILIYTPVALLLFAGADQVKLLAGVVLGTGNMAGAFLASTLALKKGAGWIRWVLVIAAVAAALRMLLS
jgi:uncharacterized membrane protein YfcA